MEDTNEGRSGTGQAHRAAPTRDAARSITVSVADAAKKNSRIDLCSRSSHLKVVVARRGRRGRLTPPDDVTPSAGSDSANRLDRTTHYAYAFGSRTVYLSCNAPCCGTTMLRNR